MKYILFRKTASLFYRINRRGQFYRWMYNFIGQNSPTLRDCLKCNQRLRIPYYPQSDLCGFISTRFRQFRSEWTERRYSSDRQRKSKFIPTTDRARSTQRNRIHSTLTSVHFQASGRWCEKDEWVGMFLWVRAAVRGMEKQTKRTYVKLYTFRTKTIAMESQFCPYESSRSPIGLFIDMVFQLANRPTTWFFVGMQKTMVYHRKMSSDQKNAYRYAENRYCDVLTFFWIFKVYYLFFSLFLRFL